MISKVELNKHVNEPRMAPVKHKGMLAVLVYCKETCVNDHHGVMLDFWSLDSQEEMDQFGHVNSTGTFFSLNYIIFNKIPKFVAPLVFYKFI